MVMVPDLPMTHVSFRGERQLTVPPSTNEIQAILGTHNWGDANVAKLYQSLAEWEQDYGTEDTPSRTAVIGAFRGGEGGAGGVVYYRAATAAAAAGALSLTNTTPARAVTLTARKNGRRADNITVTKDGDPLDATRDRVRILYRGATTETYIYLRADLASLVAAVNLRSQLVTARLDLDGTALAPITGRALVGGNDGSTLTAAEFEGAQAALEFEDFGALTVAGLTDVAIKVQLAEWMRAQDNDMRPFRVVFGGPTGESMDDAAAELAAHPELRYRGIVRFAVGDWRDTFLGKTLSSAELAPRIAGGMLARGERSALTRTAFPDLQPTGNGATREELKIGRDLGLTMLRRVSSANTTLAISHGVTTFNDRTAEGQPYELFSEPRIVGLLNRIIRQIVEWGDENVIGDKPVTDDTRFFVRKEIIKILDELEATGLAEPGQSWVLVPANALPRDAIPFKFGFVPSRTANYLIGEGQVS